MEETSTANRLRRGDVVSLDGVRFMVKVAPYGSAVIVNGRIKEEEVTLTLVREDPTVRLGRNFVEAKGDNEFARQNDLRELAIARSYIVPSIPEGADATNDYWRIRARLLAERCAS